MESKMKNVLNFEDFINEANEDVIFSVDDDKLDQLLQSTQGRNLDYVKIKGDEYYMLSQKDFDRFIDAADSRGFDVDYENSEDSLIYLVDKKGNPVQ